MNKQELIKKCNEIILKTNGGNDDYVVALCQLAMAINELDEPIAGECAFIAFKRNEFETVYRCSNCMKCYLKIIYKISNYCPNCGRKIKK